VDLAKGPADFGACFVIRDAIYSINGYAIASLDNDCAALPPFNDGPQAVGVVAGRPLTNENTFSPPALWMPAYRLRIICSEAG